MSYDIYDLKTILAEMREYNPKADEYGGKHIIPGWADRIEVAMKNSVPSLTALLNIIDRHEIELGFGERPITLSELVIARDGPDELNAIRAAGIKIKE